MKLTKHSKRYLDILMAYSNEVYRISMSKVPENTPILTIDENNEEVINDILLETVSDILAEDVCNGKISMYEMAYISVFLGEKIFQLNKILKEDNIEKKIFENLLENADDKKIAFLINSDQLLN